MDEDARRLVTIPGVGVTISTAMIAAVGKAETSNICRDLAAWLGLVPRQIDDRRQADGSWASASEATVFTQAADPWARAALPSVQKRLRLSADRRGVYSPRPSECRRGRVGEQLARICWAVLRTATVCRQASAAGGLVIGRTRPSALTG